MRIFALVCVVSFIGSFAYAVEKPPVLDNVPQTPGLYHCWFKEKPEIKTLAIVFYENDKLMVKCTDTFCAVEDFYRYSKERDRFVWGDRMADDVMYKMLAKLYHYVQTRISLQHNINDIQLQVGSTNRNRTNSCGMFNRLRNSR